MRLCYFHGRDNLHFLESTGDFLLLQTQQMLSSLRTALKMCAGIDSQKAFSVFLEVVSKPWEPPEEEPCSLYGDTGQHLLETESDTTCRKALRCTNDPCHSQYSVPHQCLVEFLNSQSSSPAIIRSNSTVGLFRGSFRAGNKD